MSKIYCEICQKKCKGDVLKLDQKFIHKSCFNCYKCNKNLDKGEFFFRENRYLCKEDYQKQYGIKCTMCNKYVDGEVITILGSAFHAQCSQCQSCKASLCCGDKATLWDGMYLCQRCASEKGEKENIAPPLVEEHSITESDIIQYPSETPINIQNVMINQCDINDIDEADQVKTQKCLQLHIENTYTGNGFEDGKAKSEMGDLNHHSPCYSLSSGDENWMRNSKAQQDRTKNNLNYGRYLNPSYLEIQNRIVKHTPPQAVYCGSNRNSNTMPLTTHFHRPKNFSYRSTSNINLRKANPFGQTMKQSLYEKFNKVTRPQSTNDINLSEEAKRLAHYPDGKAPDLNYDPPIDRYDFPAPPSISAIIQDKKKEREIKKRLSEAVGETEISNGHENAPKFGNEKKFYGKIDVGPKNDNYIDPVSASRSPDASIEPPYKPRYNKHTFTSPSRDNRFEGRSGHTLPYRKEHLNTMPPIRSSLENDSTIRFYRSYRSYQPTTQPGYMQGYLSCTDDPNSFNLRVSSLPRRWNMYSPAFANNTSYLLNNHLSPSMTTSGYSVDITTQSVDESTLIDGSGILNLGSRDGYLNDVAQSAPFAQKKDKPNWYYELENDTVFHNNYPTVQSFLKHSNMLKNKQKLPIEVYPYEKLKISNFSLPKGVDRSKLEDYLTNEDFEMVFHMSRVAFGRLPEWKRNDFKQKVDLY